jgi:hypothetical protein
MPTRTKRKHCSPETLFLQSVLQGNEDLLKEIAAKMASLEFGREKNEVVPDTKVSRTKESFPNSYELDDELVALIRPLFQPVLEEWKESHRELNIPLDFTKDEVSANLLSIIVLIFVSQTWSKKCIRRSVNRMVRKEGMTNKGANFG